MKVAIVHYHLRKGGVTRVIENAVESLRGRDVEIVVLSGEPYGGDVLMNPVVVDGLGYRNTASPELARSLESAAESALGAAPDVWHIHNHSLGKNVAMAGALGELPGRVLLQIHDFAEDGRPKNYARQRSVSAVDRWYPSGPRFHYATLNRRDAAALRGAGLNEAQLHLLPNAVIAPVSQSFDHHPFPEANRFLLYPARGIRRKNVGELGLLSLLVGMKTVLATTLGPASPKWRRFFADQCLPVHLAVSEGGGFSFSNLIAAADAFVTTSVAEGFGLAFLEPWLIGKAVLGRNLGSITRDFEGVALDHLYDRLAVPLAAIGEAAFRDELRHHLAATFRAYGRDVPVDAVDRVWSVAVSDGGVDFGSLSERLQLQALECLIANPVLLARVDCPMLDAPPESVISQNSECIEANFNLRAYGDRLIDIYQKLAATGAGGCAHLDAEAILSTFLSPESFLLLRS